MPELLERCPLCDSDDIPELFLARDPHYGINGSYRLARCSHCSLVFLNPMYSDGELAALYPADYYAYHDERGVGKWKARAKKLLGYWQGTKDPNFEEPGLMLDIGCGSGTFLSGMRNRGWSVYGVEINRAAAELAQSRGLNVFNGVLPKGGFPEESFDYVRASHSFEHITRPHETLDEVYKLLKPDGKFHIAVPNVDSVTAHLFGRNWYHLCAPVHAFHYSAETLERILRMHGFKVTNVVFNSHYAGLLGSAQIWINQKTVRRSFEGRIFNNRGLRVVSGWMERIADWFATGDMIEITAIKSQTNLPVQAGREATRPRVSVA